jgi:hypothetical protein
MSEPTRVQLSRAKGWRMPPNAVRVARPSKWGNPFKVRPDYSAFLATLAYREWILGGIEVEGRTPPSIEEIRRELGGKDLACWCRLDERCHSDVLIELANSAIPAKVSAPTLRDEGGRVKAGAERGQGK